MANKCKLIHINDGSAKILENENFHFVEEYEWAEKYLNQYLNQGYEIKHIIPEVTPAIQGEGSYNFYKSGFTAYMEKEVSKDDQSEDEEVSVDLDPMQSVPDWDGSDEDLLDELLGEDEDEEDLLAQLFAEEDDNWVPEDG